MALAYLLGKTSSKLLKTKINIPLIMVLSIIPDMDLLFLPELHRGPTHSIISALIVFVPVFALYRKKAVPYFVALISHSLVADFLVGGQIMLFWPLSQAEFGLHELGSYYIRITSPANVMAESVLFIVAVVFLFAAKDFRQFLENKKTNLVLVIPIFSVLLPSVIGFPLKVPILLIPSHLFLLVLFTISITSVIVRRAVMFLRKETKQQN